jgi:hypothetical protein
MQVEKIEKLKSLKAKEDKASFYQKRIWDEFDIEVTYQS